MNRIKTLALTAISLLIIPLGLHAQKTDSDLDLPKEKADSPYLLPGEIGAIDFPKTFKPQIQSFYWFNLGEYEKARSYHETFMGTNKVLSNEAFEKFYSLKKYDARTQVLQASAKEKVVMFNSAHHTSTAYLFIRKLLTELKAQGFTHLAIEGFSEDRITEEGYLITKGTGYYHEPQFMKMIRSALDLGFTVKGYEGSCRGRGEDCSRDREQASALSTIYSKIKNEKLLLIAGFDHINEREDHPSWGKAMAAEFKDITGVDPFTVEQELMQAKSKASTTNPYRKAIGLLERSVILKNTDGSFWIEPGGDLFDMQVFHPADRFYKGARPGEFAKNDRLIHLDSLLKGTGESANYEYPVIAKLFLKEEWERFENRAAPYDVSLISSKDDADHYLIAPSEKELMLSLRTEEGEVNISIEPRPMKATLVQNARILKDGQWTMQDFYIVDGIFRFEIAGIPEDTINLSGKYLTPGFADGHTHNLDRSWQTFLIDKYLEEGTLYIQNLTSKSKEVQKFREILNQRPSPKVRYANWGFTSTVGHPFPAYEPYAMGLMDASKWSEYADSIRVSRKDLYNSYAFVDEVSQLDSIWPNYLKTKPDLTKIYYFNEEGIDKQVMGGHGLRLEVANAIIDSAHKAGLQVYAHVESRSDFEKMTKAGVDGFAHMPGYGWNGDESTYEKYFLPDSTLFEAAKRGVIINPTAALVTQNAADKNIEACIAFQYDLISRYRKMGGTIIVGSDWFNSTASKVYNYYAKNFSFSEDKLLHLLTSETAMSIFPNEAVGQLTNGYRADFLIFNEHPVGDEEISKPEQVFINGKKVR